MLLCCFTKLKFLNYGKCCVGFGLSNAMNYFPAYFKVNFVIFKFPDIFRQFCTIFFVSFEVTVVVIPSFFECSTCGAQIIFWFVCWACCFIYNVFDQVFVIEGAFIFYSAVTKRCITDNFDELFEIHIWLFFKEFIKRL